MQAILRRHGVVALAALTLLGLSFAPTRASADNLHTYTLTISGPATGDLVSGLFGGQFDATALGIDLSTIQHVGFSTGFYDDPSDPAGQTYVTAPTDSDGPYSLTSSSPGVFILDRNHIHETVTHQTTEIEDFSLTLAGGSQVDAAGSTTNIVLGHTTVDTPLGRVLDSITDECGPYGCGTYYRYSNNHDWQTTEQDDATGGMGAYFFLDATDPAALAALRSTGHLTANYGMDGDAIFYGATITFQAVAVPEPSMGAMGAAGGLLLAGMAWRRRRG